MDRQAKKTDRQAKQPDRQTDRQKQTDRLEQTDRQTNTCKQSERQTFIYELLWRNIIIDAPGNRQTKTWLNVLYADRTTL